MKYDDDEIERHMSTNHIAPLPKHTTSGEIGQQLGLLKIQKLKIRSTFTILDCTLFVKILFS